MKRPSNLSESLHQRLNSYALAAKAAGTTALALAQPATYVAPAGAALVGVAAISQPAEAKIIYTATNVHIHTSSVFSLDLNRDGIVDFKLHDGYHAQGSQTTFGYLSAVPAQAQNKIVGQHNKRGVAVASALRRGARVGGKQAFLSQPALMAFSQRGYCTEPWANVKRRYLGLMFPIQGKTHYGWARLNVSCLDNSHVAAVLTGYAYETIPGKPIIAGKTHGKDVVTLSSPWCKELISCKAAQPGA